MGPVLENEFSVREFGPSITNLIDSVASTASNVDKKWSGNVAVVLEFGIEVIYSEDWNCDLNALSD